MDRERFDELVQRLAEAPTRRSLVQAGAAVLFGTVLPTLDASRDLASVEAKKKRKKKKKKKKAFTCPAETPIHCGGQRCCAEFEPTCCAPTDQDPEGFCTLEDEVCCPSELGGGSCPSGETCCPPTAEFPFPHCAESEQEC